MVSNASPGSAAPMMNEYFVNMAHVSSNHECAQDGYLKRAYPSITDRDLRWDSVWFFGVLGVGGWRTSDMQSARWKLGKKTHPNHGSRRCPTAAMVPSLRHHRILKLANTLCNKSMSLELENILVFTIY
jgi:hypothetical protein